MTRARTQNQNQDQDRIQAAPGSSRGQARQAKTGASQSGQSNQSGGRSGNQSGQQSGQSRTQTGRTGSSQAFANQEQSSDEPQAWQVEHPEAQALRLCVDACNATFAYLTQHDQVEDPELLACIVDCAELGATTAAFIVRGSEHADDLRETCAELAKCVEESCEEYADDEVLTACADACRDAYDALSTQSSPRVG